MQGSQEAVAENVREQVRALAAAMHGVLLRDGSLCPAAAAALQAPPFEQAPRDAPPKRARGLAAAVGVATPAQQPGSRQGGDPAAGRFPRSRNSPAV